MTCEHSRALRLADGVSAHDASELGRRLEATTTVVSLDPELPAAFLTASVLLTTLRRLPGRLILVTEGLPAAAAEALQDAVARIDSERSCELRPRSPEADITLHIGTAHRASIRLVPDGYGAHLVGDPRRPVTPSRRANALGAVYAAALGAAESFKLAADVVPRRRRLHGHLRFCPVTLTSNLGLARALPRLDLTLALVGLGAIGTAAALILGELEAEGTVLLVDLERYAPENRGTYSLGGEAEARERPWKVDVAAAALTRYSTVRFPASVERLTRAVDAGEVFWPRRVLSGLDSIEARHATQRLWPDHLIDAGTGDTMVGFQEVTGSRPCLMCFFPPRHTGRSSISRLAEATELSPARLSQGDELLAHEDIRDLSEEKRRLLEPHVGKPICGLAQALGLTAVAADGYQPAIPFAAQQAACLTVGRALARELGLTPAENLVQHDSLVGPLAATREMREPVPTCYCQERSSVIEAVRRHRRAESTVLLKRPAAAGRL